MGRKGTEELTYITTHHMESDNYLRSVRSIRPMCGEIAIDMITNYQGEEDIDNLYDENDFYAFDDLQTLLFYNDFDIKP